MARVSKTRGRKPSQVRILYPPHLLSYILIIVKQKIISYFLLIFTFAAYLFALIYVLFRSDIYAVSGMYIWENIQFQEIISGLFNLFSTNITNYYLYITILLVTVLLFLSIQIVLGLIYKNGRYKNIVLAGLFIGIISIVLLLESFLVLNKYVNCGHMILKCSINSKTEINTIGTQIRVISIKNFKGEIVEPYPYYCTYPDVFANNRLALKRIADFETTNDNIIFKYYFTQDKSFIILDTQLETINDENASVQIKDLLMHTIYEGTSCESIGNKFN